MDEWARGFRAVDFGTIHGEMDTSANYDWDDELLCAEGWASLLASVAKAAPQAAAVRADMVVEGVGFRADVFAMDRRRLVEIIERGKPEDVEALRGAGVERHLEVFKGRQERGPGGVEFAAWTALPSAHKGNLDPQEDWVAIEYLFRVCDWKPESFGNGVGQRLVLEARELEKSVRAVKRVLDGDLDDAVLMVMAHDFIGEDVHEMMEVYFGDNRGPACERLKRFLRVGRMAQGKGKRLLILMEKMR
jgi:hypothetical protein